MDELLHEFLADAAERLDAAAAELARLEQRHDDKALIASLFRHFHTIKGDSGFLNLSRVGVLAHGAECLIGRLRDGAPAGGAQTGAVFAAIDRLSQLLAEILRSGAEPAGADADVLSALERATAAAEQGASASRAPPPVSPPQPATEGGSRSSDSVRVSVAALDQLMSLVSELVLSRNQLLGLASAVGDERIRNCVQTLSGVTTSLQDAVMRTRMRPIDKLFAMLPRLARDLSIELGKKIRIETSGAETELDRHVIELMRAPLTHLIRNAADHGIESTQQRLAVGKPECGLIRVSAAYDMGRITIEISDDGRGLDAARIRQTARERGHVEAKALEALSDAELYPLVFLPGFSTASEVSRVSGRGVGLDVVRENMQSIGGVAQIHSTPGEGTTVALRIPLTLAIAPALILTCGGLRFAILQTSVVEVLSLGAGSSAEIRHIGGAPLLRWRDEDLPLVELAQALGLEGRRTEGLAVVLGVDGLRCGLVVESIAEAIEVVVEPLAPILAQAGVYAGQTILGDGSPVLILDAASIIQRAGLARSNSVIAKPAPAPFTPEREETRLLLLRTGAGPLKALPLSLVMRIEEVEASKLRSAGAGWALAQESFLLPVLAVANDFQIEARAYPMLVLAGAGLAIGLLIEDIVDVIDAPLDLSLSSADPRLIGVANLAGEVVELLDITYYFHRADPAALMRGVNRRPRVLLVDDRQFFRDMLGPIVLAAGYEVSTCAGGAEALALVGQGLKVDLLVTDIDMPQMDGYQLTREFLSRPGCAEIPVIALASQTTARVMQAARASGVAAVVGKFDRRALVGAIERRIAATQGVGFDLEQRALSEAAA